MIKKEKKPKQTKDISFFTVDCTVQSTVKSIKTAKKQKEKKIGLTRQTKLTWKTLQTKLTRQTWDSHHESLITK